MELIYFLYLRYCYGIVILVISFVLKYLLSHVCIKPCVPKWQDNILNICFVLIGLIMKFNVSWFMNKVLFRDCIYISVIQVELCIFAAVIDEVIFALDWFNCHCLGLWLPLL